MALSTIHTFLMKGTVSGSTTTWERLICITDYPEIFQNPESIDVTTLCNTGRVLEPGLDANDPLEFNAYYPSFEKFIELKALEDQDLPWALWFGGTGDGADATPTGTDGKFKWTGKVRFSLAGQGVGDARGIVIRIFPSSNPIVDAD